MVRRKLVTDLAEAREAIAADRVVVDGAPATNPARLVAAEETVGCEPPPDRYVGRGGHKLAGAIERFRLDPRGLRVIDAGASTGGFTDCVLQAGAAEVVAVDVGRGQLHQRLRDDPRVDVRERLDIRRANPDLLGGRGDLVVADLSFISLTSVLPALLRLARPGADLVLLVKPQFEAPRRHVDEGGGVISDPAVRRAAVERVLGAAEAGGAAIMGLMTSPLRGADGNVELLLHLRSPGTEPVSPDAAASVTDIEGLVHQIEELHR